MLPDQWVTDFTRCCAMTDTIMADIHNRNRLQQGGISVTKNNSHIRRSLKELDEKIEALDDSVKLQLKNLSHVTEKEAMRRQDKMIDLKTRRDELKMLLQRDPTQGPGLFGTQSAAQTRVWGAVTPNPLQETDETRDLSSEELVHIQKQKMAEQDELIERIGHSVARQKQIGLAIHDELSEQNKMLDDLEYHVDNTSNRLNREQKRIDQIMKKSSTKWLMCCLFICIIIFIVVIALIA